MKKIVKLYVQAHHKMIELWCVWEVYMEYLDIVDENNEFTGIVEERRKAHEMNLWHRHVTSWIMNTKGEILLQKRAASKPRNPNKWAKTGGHVDSGENETDAIQREIKEELGIDVPREQAKVVSIYKSTNPENRFFGYNYIFVIDYKIEDFILQKEEVSEVKYFSIEQLEEIKQKNDPNYNFTAWKDEQFQSEMELLKSKRNEILKN